jgi:hypothetical protein
VKNKYLNLCDNMQLWVGEWRFKIVDKMESAMMFDCKVINELVANLKRIFKHKYGDLFLLCFVVAVFGTLLIVSAAG